MAPGQQREKSFPPPFPGQDYVDPPRDLRGLETWVTIEPEPDDDEAPYLRVLVDEAIDQEPGIFEMAPHSSLPAGTMCANQSIG